MSGSCLGTFVLAPLSSVLSEKYGWRATVGMYAGIFILIIHVLRCPGILILQLYYMVTKLLNYSSIDLHVQHNL